MAKEKIIGIDLGTTNSVVAVMDGKETIVLEKVNKNHFNWILLKSTIVCDVLLKKILLIMPIIDPSIQLALCTN